MCPVNPAPGRSILPLLDEEVEARYAASARIKRLMEAQGLQRHVPTGQTYYTSYTDIYDWEMYFDGLAWRITAVSRTRSAVCASSWAASAKMASSVGAS